MKVLYKAYNVIIGLLSGLIAGMVFKRLWKALAKQEEAPAPTDEDTRWREVLPAAALRGAIVAVIKAAAGRSGAAGVRRLTGTWPT